MRSQTRYCFIALAALLAAVVLAGPAMAAHVNVYNASFQLDPRQEVPPAPAAGDAVGSCVAILDVGDSMLNLSCTHNVADATAAHIHFGDRGEAGPIAFPLGDGSSPILFETAVTDEQLAAFITGDYYVNVHNAANPQGILRGQMEFDAQEDAISLYVGGFAEVASCRAVLSMRTGANDMRLTCTSDADTDGIELRDGDGMVVAEFEDTSELNAVITLSDAQAADFLAGNFDLVFLDEFFDATLHLDGCFSDANTLCLNRNRFQVTVSGSAPTTGDFEGRAFQRTDFSGEFSFFNAENLELLVKVIDGCVVNNHYWVFLAAVTDVEFELTVLDTETGDTETYSNDQGNIPTSILDTDAFTHDSCP